MTLKNSLQFLLLSFRLGGILPAVLALIATLTMSKRRMLIFRSKTFAAFTLTKSVTGPLTEKSLFSVFWEVTVQNRDRINEWMLEQTRRYGRTWHVANFLVVTTPENVQHILKDNFENYDKGDEFVENFKDLLGEGIFNVNGENWRIQRKTSAKIFSRKAFATFMSEVFIHHGETVLLILQKEAEQKKTIDLQNLFYQFTLDSIGQIAFGVDLKILELGNSAFAEAFDQSQAHILNRFLDPLWTVTQSVSIEEWKQTKRLKLISEYTQNIINERRKEGVKDRVDILSFFLEKVDVNGKPFTEKYLQDIVMNFLIAGRDTTAVTLSWAFYCIATYPEITQKLLEEIDRTLKGTKPTFDDVDTRLPYLHAFIKEVLRLYPPVPKDIKSTKNDDVLPDGTFVPKGTNVVYTPYVMGRLEEMYQEPLKFDPGRWLKPESKKSPFEYPVFQAGPRTCLGQHMAFFESKLLTTMILQRFLVKLKPGAVIAPAESVTMPIKEGLPVTIHPRTVFFFEAQKTLRSLSSRL